MNLEPYDAGFLGGDDDSPTCWWHDYIQSELAAAHDHYQAQVDTLEGLLLRYKGELGVIASASYPTPKEATDAAMASHLSHLFRAMRQRAYNALHPPEVAVRLSKEEVDHIRHSLSCIESETADHFSILNKLGGPCEQSNQNQ